jgi:signal-transduction protein with cAMP-binding, CBS, and nucleotidyltransferase domain
MLAGINADSADEVTAAFQHLSALRLRQQIADYRTTGVVSNHVALTAFNRRERRRLVDALRAIEALRDQVHGEFTGQVF